MATCPASTPPDSPPLNERLRLVQHAAAQEGDAADAATGRTANLGRLGTALEVAFGLVRRFRELGMPRDSARLRDAASIACIRLMESDDHRDVACGLRFFLANQRLQIQVLHMEMELAKAGINHATRVEVAQLQSKYRGRA